MVHCSSPPSPPPLLFTATTSIRLEFRAYPSLRPNDLFFLNLRPNQICKEGNRLRSNNIWHAAATTVLVSRLCRNRWGQMNQELNTENNKNGRSNNYQKQPTKTQGRRQREWCNAMDHVTWRGECEDCHRRVGGRRRTIPLPQRSMHLYQIRWLKKGTRIQTYRAIMTC